MSTYALAGKWIRDIKQAAMRMKFVGQLIWEIRVQLLMLATISLLVVLGNLGLIPSPIDIAAYISDAFDRFGLPAIAMCSFLENIVGFNVYFPGSIVILSGMAWTAGNPLLALKVYLAIVAPAMLAQHVNYLAGRATADKPGPSDEGIERQNLKRRSNSIWFLSTFWHPHLAAMTCFICGHQRMPYRAFLPYFLLGSLVWSSVWALVLYNFGGYITNAPQFIWIVYAYLIVWLALDVRKFVIRRDRNRDAGFMSNVVH